MIKDTGGPAFPLPAHGNPERDNVWNPPEFGMSLRDYFAAQTLNAIISDCGLTAVEMAQRCYDVADAMIAERSKGGQR